VGIAVEEVAIASVAIGAGTGDDIGGGSVVATSADVPGRRYASLAASATSALSPRCLAAAGCALGVIGRTAGWFYVEETEG
jgi:hypothetical protein